MSCSPESWSGVRRGPLLALLAVVLVSVTATEDSAANATMRQSRSRGDSSFGFLECLSAVRGRSSAGSLLSRLDSDESRDSFMGRAIGCVKVPILRSLRAVRESHGADLELWNGAVVLHRVHGDAADAPPPSDDGEAQRARSLAGTDEELLAYHDIIEELNRVSRAYVMEVEVYPGVRAQLNRDQHSDDGVNLSFKLDGLADVAKRQLREEEQDDDDGDVDVVDEDESEQGRDITDYIMEDRHGHKKKKVLKGLKKLRKKLAPYLPLLAIPLAIQMMMLPLYIMALKMMALKSILLGKMTLMLVAFNILRNVQQRQMEDSHNSRVAAEYYGYSDDGIEYGGWVNRRRAFSGRSADRQQRSSRRRR